MKFHSDEDPLTKKPIDIECSASDFKKVDGEQASEALFKMAAYEEILKGHDQIALSVKYQVLCDETAMIGVIKQKDKATGDLKEYEETFEKYAKKPAPVQHQMGRGGGYRGRGRGGFAGGRFEMIKMKCAAAPRLKNRLP